MEGGESGASTSAFNASNTGGVSVTIPSTPPPAAPASGQMPAFLDTVPAEYRDKQWVGDLAKNDKPWETLVKGYDSLQTKLGQRVEGGLQVPGDDAPEEAVKAFHKALGVPDDVAGYDYKGLDVSKEPEAVQKFMASAKNDAFLNTMKAEALKIGINPKQFNAFAQAFDQHMLNQGKASLEANAKFAQEAGAKQKEAFKNFYGDKADSVMSTAKDTLMKAIPENIRATGNMEIILHEALRIISEKLYKNDTINPNPAPASGDPTTVDGLQQRIFELRKLPAYKNFQDKGYKALHEQVDGLYRQMIQMQQGGR